MVVGLRYRSLPNFITLKSSLNHKFGDGHNRSRELRLGADGRYAARLVETHILSREGIAINTGGVRPEDRAANILGLTAESDIKSVFKPLVVDPGVVRKVRLEQEVLYSDPLDVKVLQFLKPEVDEDLPPEQVTGEEIPELRMLPVNPIPLESLIDVFKHERHPPHPALDDREVHTRIAGQYP